MSKICRFPAGQDALAVGVAAGAAAGVMAGVAAAPSALAYVAAEAACAPCRTAAA